MNSLILHARRLVRASATIELAALVDVNDVEICRTGIEYSTASGPLTLTPEDLADAVEAANNDPAIRTPRIKLGHEDPRFNVDGFHAGTPDGVHDGEPALGTVQNLRLSDDGQHIFGDYTGTPEWFAYILRSAYPSRSIEGGFGVVTAEPPPTNVTGGPMETVTGHNWRFVIFDVALLGVVWPGCSTIEDIQDLYSTNGPEGVRVIEQTVEGGDMNVLVAAAGGRTVNAAVNTEDVVRQYYDTLNPDQFWWWVCAFYVDPMQLIVEDDMSDSTYRVPFAVGSDGEITFEDPVLVEVTYVDKAKAAAKVAFPNISGRQVKVYASRAETRPESEPKEDQMDPKEIRRLLGLPEDASDDQVRQALESSAQKPAEQPSTQTNTGTGPPPEQPQPTTETAPAPTAAPTPAGTTEPAPAEAAASAGVQIPEGFALVDKTTLDALKQGLATVQQIQAGANAERKSTKITAAVKSGKFPPSQVATYEQRWDTDPAGTEQLIDALPDDLVPVTMRGTNPQTGEDGTGASNDLSYIAVGAGAEAARHRQSVEAAIQDGGWVPPRIGSEA